MKNTRISMIHASFNELKFGKHWKGTESLAPPLGLMYLAHPLIEKGYDIDFIDLNVDRLEQKDFDNKLKQSDIVMLSCYSDSLKNVEKIITMTKEANPNAFVMVGGPYCKQTGDYVNGSDLTVVGEAEHCIDKIVEGVISEKPLSKVLKDMPGLIFPEGGKIIKHDGFLLNENLDNSKSAAPILAEGKDYGYFYGYKPGGLTGIMSSRGCPFSCTYCTHKGTFEAKKVRKRSVENVVEELKELKKRGNKYVIFYDDNFLVDKKRVNEIMDRAIEEKLGLKLVVQGRVDSAEPEFYNKLRKAGVMMIMFGVENANQDILDDYKKGTSIAQIKRAVKISNKAGIINFGYFIIGSHLEDRAHIDNNIRFLKQVPLDILNINILGYYKGSEMWKKAFEAGKLKENEATVIANKDFSDYSTEEWEEIRTEILKSFYKNPRRLLRLTKKIVSHGFLPHLPGLLWKFRKGFFNKIQDPFVGKDKLEEKLIGEN